MTVIMRGNHPAALWPGVRKFVMGEYNDHPKFYDKIFDMHSSNKAYEEDVELTGFGLPHVKAEGASTVYDTHEQGFTVRYTHVARSLGYIVTREELDDNQYKGKSFKRGKMLARSFRVAKEMVAANTLNRAFNPAYAGGDGAALIGDHGSIAGTWSNDLDTAADLSEASLEDMLTKIMQAKDQRGLPIAIRGMKLVIPPSLAFEAERITKSALQNDSANNAVNAIRSMGLLPGGVIVNPYLTDPDAWFILTDVPDGLMGFTRTAFEFKQDTDFDTDNAKAKGYERYSFGWTDPRAIFGSPGA